jgi:hypothetical protein
MSILGVANYLGKAESEVNDFKDVDPLVTANALALSESEALLIAAEGTPVTVPTIPGVPVVTLVGDNVVITFTNSANDGGAHIEAYYAYSTPENHVGTALASPITIPKSKFGINTGYTFKVEAENAVGFSGLTAASNSVIPNPP